MGRLPFTPAPPPPWLDSNAVPFTSFMPAPLRPAVSTHSSQTSLSAGNVKRRPLLISDWN